MKKALIFTLFAMAATCGSAQSSTGTLSIIPKVGASFSNIFKAEMGFGTNLSGNGGLQKGKTKLGLVAGADLQYQVLSPLAVSLGAYYQQMGCAFDDTDLSHAEPGAYTVFQNSRINLHYLAVPLTAHLYVARHLSLNAGVQFSFLLDNSLYSENTDVTIGRDGSYTYKRKAEKINVKDKFIKKTDISIPVGISYEYENVVIDARYNFGLSKVQTGIVDNGSKNRGFVLSAGYKFDVAKL